MSLLAMGDRKVIGQGGRRYSVLEVLNVRAVRSSRDHEMLQCRAQERGGGRRGGRILPIILFDSTHKMNNENTLVQEMPSPAYLLMPACCILSLAWKSWVQ